VFLEDDVTHNRKKEKMQRVMETRLRIANEINSGSNVPKLTKFPKKDFCAIMQI